MTCKCSIDVLMREGCMCNPTTQKILETTWYGSVNIALNSNLKQNVLCQFVSKNFAIVTTPFLSLVHCKTGIGIYKSDDVVYLNKLAQYLEEQNDWEDVSIDNLELDNIISHYADENDV